MELVKYPKTYHFEWSEGLQNDDRVQLDLSAFEGANIIISEKMDGENTTMTSGRMYARSLDSVYHESQSHVKKLWGEIKHLIPENVRICGENMAAKHSIFYNNLDSYFLCFSIWDEDRCLDWDTTCALCDDFGLITIPILWEGKFDLDFLKNFHNTLDLKHQEGYVVRLRSAFLLKDFQRSVVKFVRNGHVQTSKHWRTEKIVYNRLKKSQ